MSFDLSQSKGPGSEKSTHLREKYNKIVEKYTFPVHVIVALGAIMEVIHSDALTLAKGVGAVLSVYSWYYFFRIRTGKTFSNIANREMPAHSLAKRKWALGGMIAIPAIVALYPVFWYWFWPRRYVYFPRKEFVIAVADFEGPDENKYAVTELLRNKLDEIASHYPQILVESLASRVSSKQGSEVARKRGTEQGAAMVIWGWYKVNSKKALVSAHVETLQAYQEAAFRWKGEGSETRPVDVAALDSFDVQIRQAEDMAYLASLAIGRARFELGNLKEALSLFDAAVARSSVPEQIGGPEYAYFFRGATYYHLNDDEKAVADLTQALALNPNFAEALSNLATIALYKGDLVEAFAKSSRAIELKPDFAPAYANRASVLYKRHEYDQALKDLNKCIDLQRNLFEAYDLRGLVYTEMDNLGAARKDFDQTLHLRPGYALAYNNRGIVFSKQKKYPEAIDDFNRALEINPKYPEAYNNRGHTYWYSGRIPDAVRDFRSAISLKPDYLAALKPLAIACELWLKDRPCAIANYETALRLETDPDERAEISAALDRLRGK